MTLKKILAICLLVAGVIATVIAIKRLVFDRQPAPTASLRVDSFPQTKVIFSDKDVGQTSVLLENLSAGEYKIKLIPVGRVTGSFVAWESKIKLTAGTLTYISRHLGATEDLSGGQILMLEKLPLKTAHELAVISTPDNAVVFVDGQKEGQTSLVLKNLSIGDHEITLSLPGYSDQVVHGRILSGYRLNLVATLAKLPNNLVATNSARPTASLVATQGGEITKPYVVVKQTETGFLRVRSDPTLSATETARIKPGEKYSLLQEISGWVKIKLPTLFGWVSDAYVEKVK